MLKFTSKKLKIRKSTNLKLNRLKNKNRNYLTTKEHKML